MLGILLLIDRTSRGEYRTPTSQISGSGLGSLSNDAIYQTTQCKLCILSVPDGLQIGEDRMSKTCTYAYPGVLNMDSMLLLPMSCKNHWHGFLPSRQTLMTTTISQGPESITDDRLTGEFKRFERETQVAGRRDNDQAGDSLIEGRVDEGIHQLASLKRSMHSIEAQRVHRVEY